VSKPTYLDQIEAIDRARPPGPWEWWTSNSWRRLTHEREGDVLCPIVCRDGHPDINISEAMMEWIVAMERFAPWAIAKLRSAAEFVRQGSEMLDAECPGDGEEGWDWIQRLEKGPPGGSVPTAQAGAPSPKNPGD
jgi:hypothetical protein